MKAEELPRGEPPGTFAAIHLAARNRDAAEVARLLQDGVDPNLRNLREPNGDGGNTPLWFAAQGSQPGGEAIAQLLLAAGARVGERCEHGTTALHLAASWAHLDTVRLLVANGANPRERDGDGRTPMEMTQVGYKYILEETTAGRASAEYREWLRRMPAVLEFLTAQNTD